MYARLSNSSFTIGDKVMHHSRNDYARGLYNGSLGVITDIYAEPVPGLDESGAMVTFVAEADMDTAGRVRLGEDDLEYLSLGYAITLHKSQGSQWERVIVISEKSRIVDNTWFYTAVTRARHRVTIIGSREAFEEAVSRPPNAFRRVVGLSFQ
jgi:exodeoxyribonuclease V alpha subunit